MSAKRPHANPQPDLRSLVSAARAAARRAHAPYSEYRVGAAVRTDRGRVVSGCNVENASYGLTLCAERVAVGAAVAGGARRIVAVAIAASGPQMPVPCGACRQVLAEFAGPDTPVAVTLARAGSPVTLYRLGDLLPHAFAL